MKLPKSILSLMLCGLIALPAAAHAQDKGATQKELDKYGIKPGKSGEGIKDEAKPEEPKKAEAKKDEFKDGKVENQSDVPVVVIIKTTGGVEHVVQLGPQKTEDPEKGPVYQATPLPADAKDVAIKEDPMNPGEKGKEPKIEITHPNGYKTSLDKFGKSKPVYKGDKVYVVWNMSDVYERQAELIKEDGTKQTVKLTPYQMQVLDPGVIEVKGRGVRVWEIDPKKSEKERRTTTVEPKDGSVKIPENKTISMSTFGDEFKNNAFARGIDARDALVTHEESQSENRMEN
ncbi:MAG TPA: hypothetical protein VL688_13115, partial [Verrucomicrobiae bacterium]|jgi:hypothetical protein|nr:hypothetical protein [Verrucomicrobiae bacterium]